MTKEIIQSLFGTYVPVVYTDYVLDDAGVLQEVERIASGFAGVDWEYVLGIGLFALVLYCVLRILEAVIRNV